MNSIRQLRTEKGMTQIRLAKALGVSQAHVSLIEGNIKQASQTLLTKVAEVLDCDSDIFFTKAAQRDRQIRIINARLKALDDETISAITFLIQGLGNGRNSDSVPDEPEDPPKED